VRTYCVYTPEDCLAYARDQFRHGRLVQLEPLVCGLPAELSWGSLELFSAKVLPQLMVDQPRTKTVKPLSRGIQRRKYDARLKKGFFATRRLAAGIMPNAPVTSTSFPAKCRDSIRRGASAASLIL
jgi:hypothetical protein